MILFLSVLLGLGLSLATNMDKNMPVWFGYIFGGMCYTFVHYFYHLVVGHFMIRAHQKMHAQKGTNWNDLTDTGDVQRDIEKFASGLRQTGILAPTPETKKMYTEFEGLFTEFSDKLKTVNEKYSSKN